MPFTLDDLKNLYFGVTNPDKWRRAADELHIAGNSLSNFRNRITPSGGQPIPGPPMTFEDVWKRLSAMTNTPGKGATQPINQSGY